MNPILKEDIEIIGQHDFVKELNNKSILITGATGLIGSTLALGLLESNYNIKVIALVRSEEKAKKVFGDYYNNENLEIIIGNVLDTISYSKKVDYIVHLASATSSKYFVEKPVETIQIAINGTNNILQFAREKKIQSMVYLSSLEVYGVTDPKLESVTENMSGYIDSLKPRSSYSEGKRLAECLCASYLSEYDVPVKVARLGQTMGPGIDYNDGRVFAEFARCCIEGRNIVLHTEGKTTRNYCYTRDAALAILCVLLNGTNGEAYNVVNQETTISIRDMAEMLVKHYSEKNIKVVYEIDQVNRGYNPDVIISLNTEKLKNIGFEAKTSLLESYTRMIESMKY